MKRRISNSAQDGDSEMKGEKENRDIQRIKTQAIKARTKSKISENSEELLGLLFQRSIIPEEKKMCSESTAIHQMHNSKWKRTENGER